MTRKKTEDLLRFYGPEAPEIKIPMTLKQFEDAIREIFFGKTEDLGGVHLPKQDLPSGWTDRPPSQTDIS